MKLLHKDLTDKIIRAFFNVYNHLGYGFLEKNYENALLIELRAMGLTCSQQKPITVLYKGNVVGKYFCDILVERKVILELKAASAIAPAHEAQLLNYLKATDIEVGLLLNFGTKPEISRKLFHNHLK